MMNVKNRVIRFATALTVAGLISAQIPMSGGTALAQDGGCKFDNNGGKFLGTSLTNEQVFSGVTLGVLGYSLLKSLKDKGGVATPVPGGGGAPGGVTPPIAAVSDCQTATRVGDANKSLYDNLEAASNSFSTLKGLVDAAGIASVLKTEGPFTVFAPNNGTFGGVPKASLDALMSDKLKLAEVVSKHVVIGRYTYDDLCKMGDKNLLTLSGETVKVTHVGGKIYIDGNLVSPVDIAGSNGYGHPLGGVITK